MQSGMVIDAVRIADGADMLDADLHLPKAARGLVIFAHGSGSSRFSTRNRQVAESLNEGRFATLLLDLLTRAEERVDVRTAEYRFDIALLARRMMAATDWAMGTTGGSTPDRLLRGQHRRRGGVDRGRGKTGRLGRSLARWAAGPRR